MYARLKPPVATGICAFTQVIVRTGRGTEAVTLQARWKAEPGNNEWIVGSVRRHWRDAEIVLPFAGSSAWNGTPKTGPQFNSDQTTAIAISG